MKLWILTPNVSGGPWKPWYDKAFGFVVRAETDEDARSMAQADGGDETRNGVPAWTDSKLSSCEEISAYGSREVVMRDFRSA